MLAYCDNICAKQGKYGEYEVFSVEDAVEKFQNALFLITSKVHKENMENQLLGLNVHIDNIQFGVTEEAEDYVYRQRRKGKYAPMKLLQFEVDIVSHCNLNCKCCSQFSSIAEEEYIEPKDMEKDFRRLGELFHNEAGRIYLIGGEPLLHRISLNVCGLQGGILRKAKFRFLQTGFYCCNAAGSFGSHAVIWG